MKRLIKDGQMLWPEFFKRNFQRIRYHELISLICHSGIKVSCHFDICFLHLQCPKLFNSLSTKIPNTPRITVLCSPLNLRHIFWQKYLLFTQCACVCYFLLSSVFLCLCMFAHLALLNYFLSYSDSIFNVLLSLRCLKGTPLLHWLPWASLP